ncbi:Antidote-toxin recognition MazE, bacterial antitoxin [uncultured archaeon]|nr:Antidote-toxin recognition MazE, bacterial antitoxin [uncultured archaeon]
MRRKVIQIANSTQLVSLPRKWALQHGIKKGDELEIEDYGNKLTVSTEKTAETKPVEIDVTELDRSSIIFLIRGLYKKGYDEIKITWNKPVTTHFRVKQDVKIITAIHTEVHRLTGMEIVQQKENFCILKAISTPSDKELDSIIRRTFILLDDAVKDLIEGARNNDQSLIETICEEKHDTLTKFVSYSLRILNKIRKEDLNTHILYHIIANVDKLTDLIKNCGRELLGYDAKLRKETMLLLDKMYNSFALYHELFYKFRFETVRKLTENKELVATELSAVSHKLPPQEILLLCTLHQALELQRDLMESRMAMEF